MIYYFLVLVLVGVTANTDNVVVVELNNHIDPQQFANENGLVYRESLPNLPGYHAFNAPDKRSIEQLEHAHLRGRVVGAKSVHAQTPRKQHKRSTDPLYFRQWHLHDNTYSVKADETQLTGRGVTVAVVDDGFQHTHPDLVGNYVAQWSHDYNGGDSDPMPGGPYDGHGTSAAGVVGATQNNPHCGRGVAPDVKLVGVRSIAGPTSDYVESMALSHAYDHIDIYSCSWGPADDGLDMVEPGTLTRSTLERMTKVGRQGKGTIYVWAGGNGRDNSDNCNYDGYANSPYTIAIGAIDYRGYQSWYSEDCTALMAVAPSSGSGKGITTVDLMGSGGYDPTECTNTFGGTSSAAPLAAGVVALMLEARPVLTWRDVQHVIAKASTKVANTPLIGGGDWSATNARGYSHSDQYGFGILEIPSLIAEAKKHQLVPAQKHIQVTQTLNGVSGNIPAVAGQSLEVIIQVADRQVEGITFIEHVQLMIRLEHPHRGDVTVDLISPTGTRSSLARSRGDRHRNYQATGWTYMTVKHWGESAVAGRWTVRFYDVKPYNHMNGHVSQVELKVWGY